MNNIGKTTEWCLIELPQFAVPKDHTNSSANKIKKTWIQITYFFFIKKINANKKIKILK